MESQTIAAPAPDEYAPFYARYLAALGDADVPALLRGQPAALRAGCAGLGEAEALGRYAPGKWSVKEVIGHISDTERVMAYRALRIARGDATPLPGFDQDPYVAEAGSDGRPLAELVAEFEAVRAATLALVGSLSPAQLARRGVASGAEVSARALVHIIAGHAEHHLSLLRERYGVAIPVAHS